MATFYGLVSTWDEDATLTGADTILAQQEVLASADGRARTTPVRCSSSSTAGIA